MSLCTEGGKRVWAKRRDWYRSSHVDHPEARFSLAPIDLVIRRARRNYRCEDCREIIVAGSLHASGRFSFDFSRHFCLKCVTETRPAHEYVPELPRMAVGNLV